MFKEFFNKDDVMCFIWEEGVRGLFFKESERGVCVIF